MKIIYLFCILILAAWLFVGFSSAATTLFPSQGGTGTSTAPIAGDILMGTSGGIYKLIASSTLGGSGSGFTSAASSTGTNFTFSTTTNTITLYFPSFLDGIISSSTLGSSASLNDSAFRADVFSQSSGAAKGVAFWQNSNTLSNDANLTWASSSQLFTVTGSSTITGNVNIGIGTTTSSAQLFVYNNDTGPAFLVEDNDSFNDFTPFVIDSVGNVGVGVASPTAKFSVNASNNNSLLARFQDTDGSIRFVIKNDGRVGVGTISPSSTLDVNGSSTFRGLVTIPSLSSTVLGTDGNGQLIATSSGFTGSGAAKGLAFWQNASTLSNDTNLTWASSSQLFTITGSSTFSGNVGVGTTSPTSKFHVWGTGNTFANIESTGAGNYAQLSLTGSARSYGIGIGGASVSDGVASKLYIFDNNAAAYRMVIDTSGNVGIATTTPDSKLSTSGAVRFQGLGTGSGNGALCASTGGLVTYQAASSCLVSSLRFKEDVSPLKNSLSEVLGFKPVSFKYKEEVGNGSSTQVGFIAEEVLEVDPRLVVFDASSTPYSVRYENMVSVVVGAIQEFYLEFQTLVARITGLEKRLNEQEARIKSLEKRLDGLELSK